jgi:hypothetical protein
LAPARSGGIKKPEKSQRFGNFQGAHASNMAMASKSNIAKVVASDFVAPDLERIKRFILESIAEGAIAVLIAAIIALLSRMRDLNEELTRQLAWKRRKQPPSETLHRLQLELPFTVRRATAANDTEPDENGSSETTEPATEPKKPKKRGPKNPHRHGRPRLPAHLPRVEDVHPVEDAERICPHCAVEARASRLQSMRKARR